jgi:hypothetical protein
MIVFIRIVFISLLIFVPFNAMLFSNKSPETKCGCEYWKSKIVPNQAPSDSDMVSPKDDDSIVEAIHCLLELKGNKENSVFPSASTSLKVSGTFPSPSVEVAALYYISYMYYQKWDHSYAIVLVDKSGQYNTSESIEAAYKAYQSWFEKVKEIGLQKAREQKLDPLAGSGVRWY